MCIRGKVYAVGTSSKKYGQRSKHIAAGSDNHLEGVVKHQVARFLCGI